MIRGSTRRNASSGRAREADRGRVATGRRDVRMGRELVAVELDHAVREPPHCLGRRVRLAVPPAVDVGRQPEVGAEIDDVRDVVDETREQRLARAVRQRAEQQIETAQLGGVECRERSIAVGGPERRVQVRDAGPRLRVRR